MWGRDFGVLQTNFSDGISQMRMAKVLGVEGVFEGQRVPLHRFAGVHLL